MRKEEKEKKVKRWDNCRVTKGNEKEKKTKRQIERGGRERERLNYRNGREEERGEERPWEEGSATATTLDAGRTWIASCPKRDLTCNLEDVFIDFLLFVKS